MFRDGRISFLDIGELVEGAVEGIENYEPMTVDDVLNADFLAREFVRGKVK